MARKRLHKDRVIRKTRSTLFKIAKWILIIEICFIIVMPLVNVIVHSVFSIDDAYDALVYIVPKAPTFFNFEAAIKGLNYFTSLLLSVLYSGGLTLLQILVCSLVGYGFARFEIPFKKLFFAAVILTVVVPSHLTLAPLYDQMKSFDIFGVFGLFNGGEGINLLGTFLPAALMTIFGTGLRAGLFIFLFRQSFKGLPNSLEEASMIDGAGHLKIYARVMLPNVIPVIITVFLLSFVWQYNDTLYTTQFMPAAEMISNKISTLQGSLHNVGNFTDYKQIELVVNAGVVLTLAPLVVIYVALQRHFVEGMQSSGIVG